MTTHYEGSCHCGAIKFSYDGEEITKGIRCTCSICSRKGAMMSTEAIPLENSYTHIRVFRLIASPTNPAYLFFSPIFL